MSRERALLLSAHCTNTSAKNQQKRDLKKSRLEFEKKEKKKFGLRTFLESGVLIIYGATIQQRVWTAPPPPPPLSLDRIPLSGLRWTAGLSNTEPSLLTVRGRASLVSALPPLPPTPLHPHYPNLHPHTRTHTTPNLLSVTDTSMMQVHVMR